MGFHKQLDDFSIGGFYRRRKVFRAHVSTYSICRNDPPHATCGRTLELAVGPVCLRVSWPSKTRQTIKTFDIWPRKNS